MEKKNNYVHSTIERICLEEGETIEKQLRRLTANKQGVPQNVPEMYTEYKDGVLPQTDIRHDRFDTAYTATDKYSASKTARAAEMAAEGIDEALNNIEEQHDKNN